MRIGFDLRTLSEGKTTGVEIYAANLLKHLLANDKDNFYLAFYNSRSKGFEPAEGFKGDNFAIKSFKYPNRLLNLFLNIFNFPKLDKLLGSADVFFYPRYIFGSTSKNVKTVIAVHDLSFLFFPDFFSLKQKLWHRLISDKNACSQATRIISVSDSTKRDIIEHFDIPESKISVVYPGVDHNLYNPEKKPGDKQVLFDKYGLDSEYILFLGTVEPRKNIQGLIKGFERYISRSKNNLKLVLAGRLGWLYEDILKVIKNSPAKARILTLGFVPENIKPPLYRNCRLFVFPSFYEGFGFPPLEAMACGAPVVVSHNSSLPEVVGSAGLYINPYNPLSIADAIEAVISSPDLSAELGRNGIRQSQKFDWSKTAEETIKIFTDL